MWNRQKIKSGIRDFWGSKLERETNWKMVRWTEEFVQKRSGWLLLTV